MSIATPVAIERYPDQSAVAYCGPFALVLAHDAPAIESVNETLPWSVSLFNDEDETIVVFVAPEPAEADAVFTQFSGWLASFDGSVTWEEHIGKFFTA